MVPVYFYYRSNITMMSRPKYLQRTISFILREPTDMNNLSWVFDRLSNSDKSCEAEDKILSKFDPRRFLYDSRQLNSLTLRFLNGIISLRLLREAIAMGALGYLNHVY